MVGVLWAVINFEVEVVTDVGQAVSPIIIFDPNSVGNIGESTGRCRTVAADWPLQDGGSRLAAEVQPPSCVLSLLPFVIRRYVKCAV